MTDPVANTLITVLGGIVSTFLLLLFRRLGGVEEKVDGRFTKLEDEVKLYRAEIVRLQQPGVTTPYGTQGISTAPVVLSAGVPVANTTDAVK